MIQEKELLGLTAGDTGRSGENTRADVICAEAAQGHGGGGGAGGVAERHVEPWKQLSEKSRSTMGSLLRRVARERDRRGGRAAAEQSRHGDLLRKVEAERGIARSSRRGEQEIGRTRRHRSLEGGR